MTCNLGGLRNDNDRSEVKLAKTESPISFLATFLLNRINLSDDVWPPSSTLLERCDLTGKRIHMLTND